MGNVPQVEVHANAESPTEPGKISVVSGPLDGYCNFDSFFDELIPILKEPLYPLESYVLKRHEVKDIDADTFTVKIIHDGAKLTMYGFGSLTKDGADYLRAWQTVRCSKEKREISVEDYNEEGKLVSTSYTRFPQEPFRVEFWVDMADGTRLCDGNMATLLKNFYVVPVVKSLMTRKVTVSTGVASPGGGWTSAMSGPLDEFVDYDTCFESVIEVLKESVENKAGGQVQELSDREFEMLVTAPSIGDHSNGDTKMTQLIRHDRKTGEIINVASVGGEFLYTSWIVLHRSPLRVEHWTEVDSKRVCGRQERSVLQTFVDSIVAKSEGAGGWFF